MALKMRQQATRKAKPDVEIWLKEFEGYICIMAQADDGEPQAVITLYQDGPDVLYLEPIRCKLLRHALGVERLRVEHVMAGPG